MRLNVLRTALGAALVLFFCSCSDICDILESFGVRCPEEKSAANVIVYETGAAPTESDLSNALGFSLFDYTSDGTTVTFSNTGYAITNNRALSGVVIKEIKLAARLVSGSGILSDLSGVTSVDFPELVNVTGSRNFYNWKGLGLTKFNFPLLSSIGTSTFWRWSTENSGGAAIDSISFPSLRTLGSGTCISEFDISTKGDVVFSFPSLASISGAGHLFALQDASVVNLPSLASVSGTSNVSDLPFAVLINAPLLSSIGNNPADGAPSSFSIDRRFTSDRLKVIVSSALQTSNNGSIEEELQLLIDSYNAEVVFN